MTEYLGFTPVDAKTLAVEDAIREIARELHEPLSVHERIVVMHVLERLIERTARRERHW
jgi:hypothetical protein